MSEAENRGVCECCGYVTDDVAQLKKLETAHTGGSDFYCCSLCASTPTLNAHRYPGRYEGADVMKTVCYVGNVLLAALKK